jgi:two-component system, response regulator
MTENYVDILFAEDNLEEANLTIRTLTKANLATNLLHLRDGEEVLNYLKSNPAQKPKLILLDLKMPKVDGIQVLKYLKGDDRWKAIPVVMLTSSKEEKDMVESYKIGVNAYIVKPVSSENFKNAVQEIGIFWMTLNKTLS